MDFRIKAKFIVSDVAKPSLSGESDAMDMSKYKIKCINMTTTFRIIHYIRGIERKSQMIGKMESLKYLSMQELQPRDL